MSQADVRRRSLIILVIVLAFAILIAALLQRREQGSTVAPAIQDASAQATTSKAEAMPAPNPAAQPSAVPGRQNLAEAQSEDLGIPSNEDLQEEIQADPENVPPSVLAFASRTAKRMTEALEAKDSGPAVKLFEEMSSCAESAGGRPLPKAVRVTCLANADRLSKAHPKALESRYETLKDKVDPEIARLYQLLEVVGEGSE